MVPARNCISQEYTQEFTKFYKGYTAFYGEYTGNYKSTRSQNAGNIMTS